MRHVSPESLNPIHSANLFPPSHPGRTRDIRILIEWSRTHSLICLLIAITTPHGELHRTVVHISATPDGLRKRNPPLAYTSPSSVILTHGPASLCPLPHSSKSSRVPSTFRAGLKGMASMSSGENSLTSGYLTMSPPAPRLSPRKEGERRIERQRCLRTDCWSG